jgi:hypothetical protein
VTSKTASAADTYHVGTARSEDCRGYHHCLRGTGW